MTELDVANFPFVCRLCANTLANGARQIFENDKTTCSNEILEKITNCLPIKVEKNDKLPTSICQSCVVKLDEISSYREICINAELLLLRCLQNSTINIRSTGGQPMRIVENEEKRVIKCEEIDDVKSESSSNQLQKTTNGNLNSTSIHDEKQIKSENTANRMSENHLSDIEMSPPDNAGMSDEDDDDELDDEKGKSLTGQSSLPDLAEPSPDDYVLMKEETFNLDPPKEFGNRGQTSSILADYLIEFSNTKSGENDVKDKDILESQRLRREVLPPMWDVYEKSITEKENIVTSDGNCNDKERSVTVTHRRYIINKGAFPCSLCGECFEFDQGKRRDDFSEDKAKLYDCVTCGKVFPRRSSWKRHQSTHEDIKPYVCRLCNKGFNRKEHLTRHLLSHGSVRPYSCGTCGKQFLRKEHLSRHQISNPTCAVSVDNVLRPFSCDVCSQGFVRKEHLIRHRKRAHDLDPPEGDSEPKPFTCNICTKTFTRREHLKRHQLIHQRDFTSGGFSTLAAASARLLGCGPGNGNKSDNDTSFQSEISIFPSTPLLPEITLSEISGNGTEPDISSVTQTVYENEMKDVGGGECTNVDESGGGGGGYLPPPQYGGDEDVEMDDDDEPLPPIPVLEMNTNAVNVTPTVADISKSNTFCNVCFKNFSRRSHLLRHMKRIHCMQLPPSSRRRHVQPSLLQAQATAAVVTIATPTPPTAPKLGDENGNSLTDSTTTTTTTEQSFKCQLCGKMFTRKSHLERHEKNIHQLDKEANQPYECVTCGETFIQSKLLDKHMQVHGNTVPENYVWM